MLKTTPTTPRKLMSLTGSKASMEKTIPLGCLQMRPIQWYLKNHWIYPQSVDTPVPVSQVVGSSSVVDQTFKFEERFSTPSLTAQSPSIHRCFSKRLGCSFESSNSQWPVESGGIKLHINILELKAVFLALKSFKNQLLNQNLLISTDIS